MGQNRDLVLQQCNPAMELGFSLAEFKSRLDAIRQRMAQDNIDLLWLSAPESLYYVSGYTCEWYQAKCAEGRRLGNHQANRKAGGMAPWSIK